METKERFAGLVDKIELDRAHFLIENHSAIVVDETPTKEGQRLFDECNHKGTFAGCGPLCCPECHEDRNKRAGPPSTNLKDN